MQQRDGVDELFGPGARRLSAKETEPRRRGPRLGIAALAGAAGMLVLTAVGTVLAVTDPGSGAPTAAAIVIAFITIWGTIITFVLGALAVLLRAGRGFGVVAIVVSLIANPFVILIVLTAAGASIL